VLIYVGNKDWYCNAPGTRHLVDALIWHGTAAFRAQPFQRYQDSTVYIKAWDLLTFVEIDGAGHMAPFDQPEIALGMMLDWIFERPGSTIAR